MPDVVGAVCKHLEVPITQDQLKCISHEVFDPYKQVFELITHVDELPTDVYCRIQLKDTSKSITTQLYSSPQKYHKAWGTLL